MIPNKLVGRMMAEGELSTRMTRLPSKILAAEVSGLSVYLYLGNGLYHRVFISASASD